MHHVQRAASRRLPAILVIAVCLVVAACASGAASAPTGAEGGAGPLGQPAASAAAAGGNDGNAGGGGGGNGTPARPSVGGEGGSGGDATAFGELARIIYTGTMRLRVDDLHKSLRAGRDAVIRTGGYIASSRQSIDGTTDTASVTYRIPAARWEATVELLRGLGDQIGEEIDSNEVSSQIVDLEARIRNLRVEEAAVQRIAEQASTFEDILTGQDRLAGVRQQIEQLDAQRANLENQTSLGTLTVTYGTEAKAVARAAEAAAVAWDGPGEVARATGTLVTILQSLASFGIWFGIVWLPAIALLLLVVVVVRSVLRRSRLLDRVAAIPAASGEPRLPGP